jgi:N-acetylglucosaminyl-diphospho-decaprenol L-rhamnosyltransferase
MTGGAAGSGGTGSDTTPRGRVGVVTVAYSSDDVLVGFLESVARASARPTEVVVVDNNPAVGRSREITEAAGGRYVPLWANPGYGGAVNAGVRELPPDVEWVLISNPDIVLGDGSIDLLVERGETDAGVGAVGPLVMTDGVPYPSARSVPSLGTGIGHALLSNVWRGNRWTKRYHADSEVTERDAGWLSGACLLLRRRAFDDIAGFDESYFMYFEDVDLGDRLAKAGWRNRYLPIAVVEHSGGHSTVGESAAMKRAHHDSAYRFLARRYPGAVNLPLRVVLRVGLWLRARLGTRTI